MHAATQWTRTVTTARRRGLVAVALGVIGLTVGTFSTMLVVATFGVSTATATSIVNAIIAGSSVATAVAAVLGGGITGAALLVIRQAVLRGVSETALVA